MKKQNTEIIITSALFVVLVVLAVSTARERAGKKKEKPAPVKDSLSVLKTEISSGLPEEKFPDLFEKQKQRREGGWGNDPFSRRDEYGGGILRVTGIIFDGEKTDAAYAIINNRVVKKGDSIEGARIIAIDAESVTLDKDGETALLMLEKGK